MEMVTATDTKSVMAAGYGNVHDYFAQQKIFLPNQ
jgi:hypothetical protein